MRTVPDEIRLEFLKRVKKEFPNDVVMQDIHLSRLIQHFSLKDSSDGEWLEYYNSALKRHPQHELI